VGQRARAGGAPSGDAVAVVVVASPQVIVQVSVPPAASANCADRGTEVFTATTVPLAGSDTLVCDHRGGRVILMTLVEDGSVATGEPEGQVLGAATARYALMAKPLFAPAPAPRWLSPGTRP
jgi:putative hemolysin